MLEVAEADPDGRDIDIVLRGSVTTNERAIAITEALLTLARVGQRRRDRRHPVDLADIVERRRRQSEWAEAGGARHPSST